MSRVKHIVQSPIGPHPTNIDIALEYIEVSKVWSDECKRNIKATTTVAQCFSQNDYGSQLETTYV